MLVAPGCSVIEGSGGDGGAVTRPTAEAIPTGTVLVQDIAFTPARTTVKVGEEVTWTVDDGGLKHTITADDASFDSGELTTGSFKQTFAAAGEVAYHCNVHVRMKGSVVVTG